MSQKNRLLDIANPGANAVAVLYDDNNHDRARAMPDRTRVRVVSYIDKDHTIKTWWSPTSTGPLRLMTSTPVTSGAVKAASAVTCVAKADLAAGGGTNDYITVTVGSATGETSTTVTFEYKVDESFVATEGRTTIDVSALTTATEVATATAAALRTAFGSLISIPAVTTAVLTATHAYSGTAHPLTVVEHVANAGYSVALTSPVDGTGNKHDVRLEPGRNKITLHTGTAPTEFDVAVEMIDDPVAS